MADATRPEAAQRLPDRIAFLGFGLIGGSIALALREAGSRARLVAWTPTGTGPSEGLRQRLLDSAAATPAEAIDRAGLVILAGPPLAVLQHLSDLAGPMRGTLSADATITDVASTKALIVENAAAYDLPFVGGHPMAGREATGVGAATADLFLDRPWAVVRAASSRPVDIDRVGALAVAVGARPIEIAPHDHDVAVAGISHLPLVLAAALVESVASSPEGAPSWPLARALAAGGWAGMTRLARGDPEMGAGILATNCGPVAERLRAIRSILDGWIEDVDPSIGGGDVGTLLGRLHAAQEALEEPPA